MVMVCMYLWLESESKSMHWPELAGQLGLKSRQSPNSALAAHHPVIVVKAIGRKDRCVKIAINYQISVVESRVKFDVIDGET